MKGKNCHCRDWGIFVVRAVVALIFLYHGMPKLLDVAGTMSFFSSLGLPGFLGPIVGVVEVIGAILILLGFWTEYVSYALSVIIVGALFTVQIPGAIAEGTITAGLERDVLLLACLLMLAWVGAGWISFERKLLERSTKK